LVCSLIILLLKLLKHCYGTLIYVNSFLCKPAINIYLKSIKTVVKKKLNVLFLLVSLALSGIIIFQVYWSINAYHVNKNKFDTDIDDAMQKAMDDCKKDYFDSIKVVMVKRMSDTANIKIKVDTVFHDDNAIFIHNPNMDAETKKRLEALRTPPVPGAPKKIDQLRILIANKYVNMGRPFTFYTTVGKQDFYRAKITHKNATLPEILVETSFYVPNLLDSIRNSFMLQDISTNVITPMRVVSKDKKGSPVVSFKFKTFGIFELPPNYRGADSLKLSHYFRKELDKMHIPSPFRLQVSDSATHPQKLNMHFSETNEYNYQYHGFVFLHGTNQQLFMRAIFTNPQYAIIKGMLLTLCMSALLIAFTIYCFYYIIQLVIHQKKLAELKDDFINNMTHELKTPIATITVAVEGLQKFNALNDPEKTKRYLQTARTELLRLDNLVTKVLNVATFENKDVVLDKEKINVDDMVNEIISSERSKSNKEFNITYINNDVKTIYADKLHFRNVLLNIVDNAIKYSNEPVNIIINCFKQGSNAIFSIKDNGIGIPESHIKQVFDKFHRVPTGNVHNVKGTGLGLSYAKYIVAAHGGDITVKSEINKGSEFIVSIPLSDG